jgi:hypothetical protein
MPNRGSQSGGLLPSFEGSQLRLVTGDYVRVIEDYPVAHERLWPAKTDLVSGVVPVDMLPQPIKKTPAKKSSPRVVDPAPVPIPNEDKTEAEPAAESSEPEEKDED